MTSRDRWIAFLTLAGAAVFTVILVSWWSRREEADRRLLEGMLVGSETSRLGQSEEVLAMHRRDVSRLQSERARAIYTEAIEAHAAASDAHERGMAIDMLAGLLAEREAISAGDREIVANRLEELFLRESDPGVREEIIEAIGRGESSAVARVLWAALADSNADVRERGALEIETLLVGKAHRGTRARAELVAKILASRAEPAPSEHLEELLKILADEGDAQ